ncbi:MAG: hypothetical protein ACJAXW_003478 [Candidatus Azotimanducaceae bacterium]
MRQIIRRINARNSIAKNRYRTVSPRWGHIGQQHLMTSVKQALDQPCSGDGFTRGNGVNPNCARRYAADPAHSMAQVSPVMRLFNRTPK